MNYQKNIALAPHTYFRIGGIADLFVEAKTRDELIEATQYAIQSQIPYLVLGGGSNVLVDDQGFRGLVIKNKTSGIKIAGYSGGIKDGKTKFKEVVIQAESGVIVNYFIRHTLDQGLSGLEHMFGLPGTIGGAVYNNSHHLDKLWGDHIVEVETIGRDGSIKKYTHEQCQFEYDHSIFHKNKDVILSASFQLISKDKEKLWEVANAAIQRRSSTQPLGKPSSGCMFKNISLADKLRLGLPTQSAGYLIDKAGLKGERVGGASVSSVHANFLINDSSATSQDVIILSSKIKEVIKEKFGVDLVEEVFHIK